MRRLHKLWVSPLRFKGLLAEALVRLWVLTNAQVFAPARPRAMVDASPSRL